MQAAKDRVEFVFQSAQRYLSDVLIFIKGGPENQSGFAVLADVCPSKSCFAAACRRPKIGVRGSEISWQFSILK